ncbi:MAG: hypothetical protein ACTS2F_04580 [Thainema sp.]
MAKKRLSDLLREEAQAPDSTDQSPDQSNDAEPEVETNAAIATVDTTAVDVDDQPSDQFSTTSSEADFDEADDDTDDHVKRSSRTTKAELNDMITDLESKLDAARETESALNQQVQDLEADLQEQSVMVKQLQAKLDPTQQQIQDLQAELKQQQKLTHQLQTELNQTQQLKQELAEAKQTILQLTEVNQNLQSSAASAPVSARSTPAPARPGAAIVPRRGPIQRPVATSASLTAQPESVPELEDTNPARPVASHGINPQSYYHPEPKRLRRQSVVPAKSTQNSMLSDDDIGWVD